jgi:hypothetical protein
MGTLFPFGAAQAETSSQLVTCINLTTKSERISHTGKCRITQEAQANWHVLNSDSRLPEKEKSKSLLVCSNKSTSPVSYQIIRKRCASHQIRTEYYRSSLLVQAPTITKVVATGHDTAQVSLAKDSSANPDAPVAYYTITSSKGQTKNVYTWGELNLTIDNLSELTTYSFTVTATTADGTSNVSTASDSVTTAKYVAPPAPATKTVAAPVAQVNLISSDNAAVTIPAGATSMVVAAPALLNPSVSFGAQGAGISAVIQATTNPAGTGSTPFTVSGSTKIVDIAITGLSGSATICLDASPTAKLWHYVSGAWVDITTSRTSSQVCGVASSFSPFAAANKIEYTVGQTGPGGGKIFYVNMDGFSCGPTLNSICQYLEMAPSCWHGDPCDSDVKDPYIQWGKSEFSELSVPGIVDEFSANISSTGIGLGYRNSIAIVLQQGNDTTTAAGLARAYNGNGLSDWYLPSLAELHQIQQWRLTNEVAFKAIFGTSSYQQIWTSSTMDLSGAWFYTSDITTGTPDHSIKPFPWLTMHPIRAF